MIQAMFNGYYEVMKLASLLLAVVTPVMLSIFIPVYLVSVLHKNRTGRGIVVSEDDCN